MPPTFSRVVPSAEVSLDATYTSRMEMMFRRLQGQETSQGAAAQSDVSQQRSVAAGTLAALMEEKDPVSVMRKAKERFRCVSC